MSARTQPSVVKAHDVLDVRFALPDLEKAEVFLTDFGLAPDRGSDQLTGSRANAQPCYIATKADEGKAVFLGFSFVLNSPDEIRSLADLSGISPRDSAEGLTVALTDPDGFQVNAIVPATPIDHPNNAVGRNESGTRTRTRSRLQVPTGPSKVMRLGHVVLQVSDFERSLAWYQDHFGLLVSDSVVGPDGETTVGAFLRCDRGDEVTDHHSLFLMRSPDGTARMEHAAFEVSDIDSLMAGAEHLKARGYEHEWGIGRHQLGAHIFDYWRDPFGFTLEHWTDGDLIDSSDPEGKHDMMALLGSQWGPPHALLGGSQ